MVQNILSIPCTFFVPPMAQNHDFPLLIELKNKAQEQHTRPTVMQVNNGSAGDASRCDRLPS